MLSRRRNQSGDTLIEVLIAIAIVSLILAVAYAITNQNTQAIQANQERVQAQHIVESQIEALKAKGSLDNPDDCFIGADEKSPSDAGDPCGNVTASGSGATYDVHVAGPHNGVYTITATWTSLGGHSADDSNVTMFYRLD